MITLLNVKIKGFGVFREEQVVNLAAPGLTLINGLNLDSTVLSNGSGKTTIFRAITWALYGTTIDGLKTDVINRQSDAASVTIEFMIDDTYAYEVLRTRSKSGGKLFFKCTSTFDDFTAQKQADTQLAISNMIGDFDVFRCLSLFGQGDISRFASPHVTDASRKEILSKLLGLSKFDDAREAARAAAKTASAARIAQRKKVEDTERAAARLLTKREEWGASLELATARRDKVSGRVDDLRARLASLEDKWSRIGTYTQDDKATLKGFRKEEEEVIDLLDKVGELSDKIASRARQERIAIDTFAEGSCPTCGQEPPPGMLKKAEGKLKKAEVKLKKVDLQAAPLREELDDIREDIRKVKEKINASAEERSSIDVRIAKVKGELELAKQLDDFGAEIAELTQLIEDATEKEKKLKRAHNSATKQIARIEEDLAVAEWWSRTGFGPKGVPAYAIEQVLPRLNELTNTHLSEFAGNDLRVSWSALAPGKSGTKEQLHCQMTIDGLEGVNPSGGQMRKIELATELGLAEIVQETLPNVGFKTLFFDEALDNLDIIAARQVIEWFRTLSESYPSVFVVSHASSMVDAFDQTLVVTKEGGSASIEGGE